MRNWTVLFLAMSVCPSGSRAAADDSVTPAAVGAEAIPVYVEAYPTLDGAWREGFEAPPSRAAGLEGERAAGSRLDVMGGEPLEAKSGWRTYLPVFYSLLLPGAGEIALGAYKRGAALAALEATAWTGYAINRNRGLDSRAEFEAFADRHWNHGRWIREHVATAMMGGNPDSVTFAELDAFGRSAAYAGAWPGYHPYAAKEDEKLNYYENIGKYDWFISGWEDWTRAPLGTTQPSNTDLRTQYRSIRNRSNDQLDRADRFVFLSVAARVFSLVETVVMVRNRNAAAGRAAAQAKRYSFTARSTGLASGEIAFEYRFR
ncbi:MAG: hypothetical protein ACE5EO_11695 [Candidatus Krumholzibacteriia bacterium]